MDGGIETAAGKNEGFHPLCKMHANVRMLLLELWQSGNQPPHRECRDDGNVEAGTIDWLSHQVLAVPLQPVERLAHLRRIALPVRQ
ncbi:hypothetical protein D3C72_1946570 [compost metagenome]